MPEVDLTTGRRISHHGNRIAKGMVIGLVVIVVGAVLFTMRGAFSSRGSGDVVFHDEFDAPNNGWPDRDEGKAAFGFVDQGYRVVVRQPETSYVVWHLGHDGSWDAVSVEASASKTAENVPQGMFGVACGTTLGRAYALAVNPDSGDFAIAKLGTGQTFVRLARGNDPSAVSTGGPLRIRGTCAGGDDGTTLILFVNGEEITSVVDQVQGLAAFRGGGMFVSSLDGGTEVHFDDLVMQVL